MDAAEIIRSVRRRAGLTQRQLAERSGTSQPVVSAYEHGQREPSIGTLRRLVGAAGERLVLDARAVPDGIGPPIGPEEHGRRLLDVLSLADAVPARPRDPVLRAPRLTSRC